MEKRLFISSSNRFPAGFALFLVFLLALELLFFSRGPLISDMSTLSVTRTAGLIEEGRPLDILLMGASRSLAIDATQLASELEDYQRIANYSVPSVGTSLQYSMILQKYLDNTEKPDLILLALGPEIFGQFRVDALFYTLWSGEADRFRRFFSLPELLEYMPFKEKIFLLPMYARNLLNSYNYRVYVRDYLDFHLFGVDKWGVGDVIERNHRLLEKMEKTGGQMIYWPDRKVPMEEMIFENILPLGGLAEYEYHSMYLRKDENLRRFFHMAAAEEIPVVAFMMPVPRPRYELMQKYGNFNYIRRRMGEFEDRFKSLLFLDLDINWDMQYFGDSSHLNAEGARRFNDQFGPKLEQLLDRGLGVEALAGDGLFFDLGSSSNGRVLIDGFHLAEENPQTGETWLWSAGKASSMRFPWIHTSDPTRFRVTFSVEPFVPQVGREILLETGLSSAAVILQPGLQEYSVELLFPAGRELQLSIAYQAVASPQQLGLSEDARELAVRWVDLRLQYGDGIAAPRLH